MNLKQPIASLRKSELRMEGAPSRPCASKKKTTKKSASKTTKKTTKKPAKKSRKPYKSIYKMVLA